MIDFFVKICSMLEDLVTCCDRKTKEASDEHRKYISCDFFSGNKAEN